MYDLICVSAIAEGSESSQLCAGYCKRKCSISIDY